MAQANVRKAMRKHKVGKRRLAAKVDNARQGTEGTRQKNMVRSGLGGNRAWTLVEHPCSTREIDRDSHFHWWECRHFESLVNDLLDELRPRDRAVCVSAWASQSESGQRLGHADLREQCAEHHADPDAVLPVFGYVRIAVTDSLGTVIGPSSPMDLLNFSKLFAVYVDPMTPGAVSALFLLREAFDLSNHKIPFHGAKITETEHWYEIRNTGSTAAIIFGSGRSTWLRWTKPEQDNYCRWTLAGNRSDG